MSEVLADMWAAGLEVNWLTLLLGLEGPGKHPPVLTLQEVAAFATEQISFAIDPEAGAAVLVAMDDGQDKTREVLRNLAGLEHRSAEQELRKWRVALLKREIGHLPADPLYGLLALTDFWERFDFPPDSPHVVQGRGNTTSPSEYYTEENFRALVQKHIDWIASEITALRRR